MTREWQTASADETIAVGRELAALLPARAVVLLTGDLGAGKTTLTKGILAGLGVADPDEVSSPTYTLIHEHTGSGRRAYHVDLYRLDEPREVATLGLDDLFDQDAVVLIEWGERFARLLPSDAWRITLTADGDRRTVRLASP